MQIKSFNELQSVMIQRIFDTLTVSRSEIDFRKRTRFMLQVYVR